MHRHYAKVCDIRDFDDPAFRARAAELRPDLDLAWQLDRKTWELTMLSLFLEEAGVLDGRSEVLSVGAGREAIVFWLARRVGRMVASDLYGHGEFAGSEAPEEMLVHPERLSPYGGELGNLEVRVADGRSLEEFGDASFDAVFSLSSIEHFGAAAEIRRAAAAVGRVLRPGGVAFLATELSLSSPPAPRRVAQAALRALSGGRLARREVSSREELPRAVIDPSGLDLLQALELSISPESFDNLAVRRFRRWLRTPTGSFHPHMALRVAGETFTSVALPLCKGALTAT